MASLLSSGDLTREQILSYQATSADLSFDNSYYFTSDYEGYAGTTSFRVYYWNTTTSSWDQKYTQTTSQTNFGYQIACTWDGDRFVVGSPDENKVYVYHSPGGSGSQKWTHNASGVVTAPTVYTISCPDSGSRRFGWSVSIAKDRGNHIVIGAPGNGGTSTDTSGLERGKVYIYEFNGSTWSKTFDKTANQANTDCDGNTGNNACIYQPQVQRYPSGTTSGQAFYRVTDSSPQFGYYVDISGYAEYIAIGVPGTGVPRLREQNMDGYSGNIDVIRSGANSDYIEDIAMLGCIICYKTTNANKSWSSNTSLHGKPVLGQTEMSLDSVPASYEPQTSFDFTALGTTCKISLDGTRLIGGSPRYSYPGMQQSPHFGRLDAWNYSTTDTDWVLGKGRVVGHRTGNRLGTKIAIDYTGQRVAALLMKEPDIYDDVPDPTINKTGLMVYDWNGNGFYEVTPEVQTNLGSEGHNIYASIAISKGDVIGVYAHGAVLSTSKTSFYFYKLTGGFDGNSLVGGYCAADTFLVGPNDGSTQNTFKKQIKFGGTFFDNTYENTTIENRIYQFDTTVGEVNHQGYSELLISKKTTGAAPDMIRLKANELRIDNHASLDQFPNNTHFTTSADGEYDHNGALLMNVAGNFKINPTYDVSRYTGSTPDVETLADTQDEVKASLDVEGDIFGRRRINAGYLNGQRILGRKWPWQLLYDTRSGRVKQGDDLISNTFCEFNAANVYNHGRINSKGTKSGTMVTHYETQGAIKFTNASDYIHNNTNGIIKSIGSNGISGSLWIKLENEHSSYPDSSAGGCTLISYGTPSTTSHTGMRLQIEGGTHPNIRFRLGSGAVFPSNGYIFTKDKWYHIYYAFKPTVASKNSFDVWINNVSIPSFGSYSLSSATYSANHYIGSPLGDTATNVYIGMVAHFNSHIDTDFHLGSYVDYVGKFPNASEMYHWGSPQEKLAVGGDAFIENRLSIGGTHSPDHTLDVTGDINLTGSLRVGTNASTGTSGQVLTSSGGGAMSWTNKIWTPCIISHPTVTMTSASSGGYTVSDSSNLGTGNEGWNAFDASSSTSWATSPNYLGSSTGSYYNGTTSTTYNGSLTVNGDWVQLQTPFSTVIYKIDILPYSTSNELCPRTGKLLGSNDGSTWTEIHGFTNQIYTTGQYTTISFTNTVAYSHLRLVCEDMEYFTSSIDPRTGAVTYSSSSIEIAEIIFYVNSSDICYNTGNVGIGTTGGPYYPLDVNGDINMSSGSSLRINGVAQTFPWTTSGSDIYRSSGKIGINTSSPLFTLDVDGDINMSSGSSFRINGVAQTFGGGSGGSSVWGVDTTTNNAYYLLGNIGIGITNPAYHLDVAGDINFTGELSVNGSVGTSGQVLTSSGPGSAPTWTTVSGGGGGGVWTTGTGNDIYYTSGNVGIANTAPTNTLDIGSNVSIIDDGVDKLVIRGNVYSTHDIISLGTIHCKEIVAVNSRIKNSTVVTEAPTRQIRSI